MPGKRVQFDAEIWASVDLLAKDRMMTFQELADEAFRDILRKYNRPFSLKEALRKSAGVSADILSLRKTEQPNNPGSKRRTTTRRKGIKKGSEPSH